MAYHHPSYPDSYAGYYPAQSWTPATAPPGGGDGRIQFGTFEGLSEMQGAVPGYGPGGFPPMYHMGPAPFPYAQPPPHHMPHPPRSSSRNKVRDGDKRRAEASRPPGPPEGRPGQSRDGAGQGNYPPQHYSHRPPAQQMQYAYVPYPMYPPYGHPGMHQHPPEYMYKFPSQRLPLENNIPPLPNSAPPSHGRNGHQETDVQSPKSTTSTQSRSRKQLSLVHPQTGMQIEHEELRPPSQSSMMPPRKQVSPPHSVQREPLVDKAMPKASLHSTQGRESQRKIEEKTHSKRTKPMTSSEVMLVSTAKQPPSEDMRKPEPPREKKTLQLQSPRLDEVPDNIILHESTSKESTMLVHEHKVPHTRPTRKEASPCEGHGFVQSTVVQVPVTQTQMPQKVLSHPVDRRPDVKEVKPEPARGRVPESKIPTAPSTKLSTSMAQPPASHEPSNQEVLAEKVEAAQEMPQEEPTSIETLPVQEDIAPTKVDEDAVQNVGTKVQAEVVEDVQDQTEGHVDAVPAAIDSISSNNLSEDRVKSPETVIVNEGEDDSQDEEDKCDSGKLAGEARVWEEPEAQPEVTASLEVPVWNNEDSTEESKKEAPVRQDSISRKASGSLKSMQSRSSLEKPASGWRLQRENSRRVGKARLDDSEVFHKSSGNRTYSTEFMLLIRDKYPEKPNGVADTSVWRDNLGGGLKSRASADRSRWSGKGSLDEAESRMDRSSSRVATAWRDAGRQYSNGQRSGASRSVHRGRDMDDRWASRMASPFVTGGGVSGLHRAEDRYVVGEMISDDHEEEARQKKYKAVLNKLTPENFDRMFEQIKQVEVKEHKTLEGLIDQIFDKALNETTFCPLYANLCRKLMSSMPEFEVEGDKRKVTFRRLLLNKCQNEFEKGDAALRAADEVEKRGLDSPEEIEKLRAAKKERMRSLGNMQFIGHLFKEEMLTEKIIHQCIVDLLREQDNPKFEDIECLCQLVSTVGRQLKDCKELGAYFSRIKRLTEKCELDTRHRFMLLDLIELRDRQWVARRKSEGPKKIDEIRRDAQEELTSKDPKRSGWGGLSSRSSRDRVDRTGGAWQSRPSAPTRTSSNLANVPFEREVIEPLSRRTSIGRTNSDDISLRPASGVIKASTRSAQQRPEQKPVEASSQDSHPAGSRVRTASPPRGGKEKAQARPIFEEGMDPDTLRRKVKSFLEEFYQQPDLEEVKTCIGDLVGGGASKEEIVTAAIRVALDLRNVPVDERLTPLCGMMCDLIKDETFRPNHLRKGVEKALASLPEIAEDFPKAPVLLADMMEDLQRREKIPTSTIIKMIQGAGQDSVRDGEDTALVDSGFAIKVFLRILRNQLKSAKNPLPVKEEIVQLGVLNLYPSIERDRININEVLGFLDEVRPS